MSIMHKLFYWNINNSHAFSRTKFLTLIVFIVGFIYGLQDFSILMAIFMGLVFAIPIFIIGFLVHTYMDIDSGFYNGNISDDLKHFLFYWYDGHNGFVISKTKIITFIIVAIGFLSGFKSALPGQNSAEAFAYTVISLMIAVPVFLMGYIIHNRNFQNNPSKSSKQNVKNTSSTSQSDTNQNTVFNGDISNNSSNLNKYAFKAKELKKEFDEKELKTRKLIDTKFEPPQITYDKFIEIVDNCNKVFNNQYVSLMNLINFSKEDSARIEDEINSKINNLEAIIEKLDDLSSELVINISKSNNDDIDGVLNDMESLITSIHNYED